LITSISAPTFPAFKPLPKVHDYTLLFTRNGRAPYILGCVAEIVTANGWKTFIPVAAHARGRHLEAERGPAAQLHFFLVPAPNEVLGNHR
jgi:hypothetical protein